LTSTDLGATNATANTELAKLDTDIDAVNTVRATWGATQNRFDSVISNLRVGAENSAASRGRIMDADYATETANLSRSQVLQQAGTAMVAQANQAPQGVLALLR
jgi:flagellin